MKLELPPEKLRALPVQLIETAAGAVVKRGRVEVTITGEQAGEALRILLQAAFEGATREEICAHFSEPERPAVEALIQHLLGRRLLVLENGSEAEETAGESNLDVLFWHFAPRPREVTRRISNQRFHILGVNLISRRLAAGLKASGAESITVVDEPLLRNLALFEEQGGLKAEEWPQTLGAPSRNGAGPGGLDPESVDCVVATSDFGGTETLRSWSEFCVLHHRHFLPVFLQDLVGYVGPLMVPGESPCFECLRSRQNAHLSDPRSHRAAEAAFSPESSVVGFHPSMASILGDVAAIELTKYFGLGPPLGKAGTLIEVNLLGAEMKARKVLRQPRCAVCSNLNQSPPAPLDRGFLMPSYREPRG